MRSLILKGRNIIQNDGILVFVKRLFSYTIVKIKRKIRGNQEDNIRKWKNIKGKYNGERIFIIGNGPSLNKMPLHLLEHEYVMAFNRFNLMFDRLNWRPDFYMVTDDLVIKDMYQQINEEILNTVKYSFFPDIHPSNVEFDSYISNLESVHWMNMDAPEFSIDLPKCGINKTVINAGMQVAAYMGFKEIYLIGVDMTFKEHKVKKTNSRNWEAEENDPNHFDPRYFGKGLKYHNPTVHEMLEKFKEGKEFLESLNVKVFNAGVGGNLEVFTRVKFESVVNLIDEEIVKILNKSKNLTDKKLNFNDLINSEKIDTELPNYPNIFKTDLDFGCSMIPNLIFDYIPIGPFQNNYFFIKRQF